MLSPNRWCAPRATAWSRSRARTTPRACTSGSGGDRSVSASACQIPPQPSQELAIPVKRVAGLEDPVVLIGVVHEPSGNAAGLEDRVELQPLRRRHAVVEL